MAKINEIEAGKLCEYVSLQRATTTQDNTGAEIKTWSTYNFAWAYVETLTERERLVASQLMVEATHRVIIRWDLLALPVDRILWGTRILDVSSVIDPGQRHNLLILECRERVV